MAVIELSVTCANEKQARSIALEALRKKLAACANYWPVKSAYWWNGKLFEEGEVILVLKTSTKKAAALEKLVRKMHSYKLPAIAVVRAKASKQVEKWIAESTK